MNQAFPCPDRVCYHYTNSPRSLSRFWNDTLSEIGLSAANPTLARVNLIVQGPNVASYKLEDSKTIQLIDIPGADRLRFNAIQKFKSNVCGIILVVNSEKIQKELRDVAELLFSLLTDEKIHRLNPRILIAANQQDCAIAKKWIFTEYFEIQSLNTYRTL